MFNISRNILLQIRKSDHISISNIRNYVTRKRFYKRTNVLYNDGVYEITLDQRKLQTPGGALFTVTSEPLALAVAAEWDAQKDKIQQSTMHLTALCSTVIDNPNRLTKYSMVQYILNYLDTDTVLFQSSENDDLYKLQLQEWDPIIKWFCERYQVDVSKSRDIKVPNISMESKATIQRHLMSYDINAIQGFVFGVDTIKSVILVLACVDRFISVEQAVLLSRLEEEFQINFWGRVEWGHELSQQDLQSRLAAAILFIHLNSSSTLVKMKEKQ